MATKIKCINKVRDAKGNIKVYQLIDENGNKIEATSAQVKAEIRSGRYDFLNLQIDKAGRLVDKAEVKTAVKPEVKSNHYKPKKSAYQIAVEQFKKECEQYLEEDWTIDESVCSDSDFESILTEVELPEPLRGIIQKLLTELEETAKKDAVIIYRPLWDDNYTTNDIIKNSTGLSKNLIKFMKDTGANGNFIIKLFESVAQKNEIPSFEFDTETILERDFTTKSAIMSYNLNNIFNFIKHAFDEKKEYYEGCHDDDDDKYYSIGNFKFLGNNAGKDIFESYKGKYYKSLSDNDIRKELKGLTEGIIYRDYKGNFVERLMISTKNACVKEICEELCTTRAADELLRRVADEKCTSTRSQEVLKECSCIIRNIVNDTVNEHLNEGIKVLLDKAKIGIYVIMKDGLQTGLIISPEGISFNDDFLVDKLYELKQDYQRMNVDKTFDDVILDVLKEINQEDKLGLYFATNSKTDSTIYSTSQMVISEWMYNQLIMYMEEGFSEDEITDWIETNIETSID